MPESILLFGRHNELKIVTGVHSDTIKPPIEIAANNGYFAYPSLSPKGDALAWGFARELRKDDSVRSARFSLGVFSLAARRWTTFGDFDNVGATAFSADGSKIAFVAEQEKKKALFVLDIGTGTISSGPYPKGMPESGGLSWSPNANKLAVEIQQGDKNPLIAILDLDTGSLKPIGEGINPSWSPKGEWIAYFDAPGARCIMVHPDGSGEKTVVSLRQSTVSYRRFGWGSPVWSPDGTRVLLDEMKGDGDYNDTVLLDIQTGQTTTKARNAMPVFGWAVSASSSRD